MRTEKCPICQSECPAFLQIHFNVKMSLPTEVRIRHCEQDNFLFADGGEQFSYDEYYKSLANDSYHSEMANGELHSPMSRLQQENLVGLLGIFFDQRRKVLDFGCGEARLLLGLASKFSSSDFWGFDPSPGAQAGARTAQKIGLRNVTISDLSPGNGPYDLILASHVLEHLIDFDMLRSWNALLDGKGFMYIEVPNALQYAVCGRTEFLYYFDRLHVNHFTPHSLAQLVARYGFSYVSHIEYGFPYRDAKPYPALGMLFRKGGRAVEIASRSVFQAGMLYLSQEKERAKLLNGQLKMHEGVLVWGAGDNFYRSIENEGPLSNLPQIVVLDSRPQVVTVGAKTWNTEIPSEGIRRYPWPVVITVSERRSAIGQQVRDIDPSRQIYFL